MESPGSCLLVLVASEYQFQAEPELTLMDYSLTKSFVERSKESLDPVAPDLVVADVIQIFS